jgi:Na+/melibiose symporter-like transporter
MNHGHRRIWLLIAAIAIAVALVLVLVPQSHSGPANVWLAMLPVFFVGLLVPLCLISVLESLDGDRVAAVPALQPYFQRPPPLRLA